MQPDYLFVADESVDYNLIIFLRNKGLVVYSIIEKVPSLDDPDVLKIAVDKNAVLITEDKDFGELIFKLDLPHKGVFLIRIVGMHPEEKTKLILHFILKFSDELPNSFTVVKQRKLRIRKK
jgi:predicted nuclease of predicted toxin-antitoxin system